MKAKHEFADYVVELLSSVGNVHARRMFGGYGIYCDGTMFALIADDVLYFKADEVNRPEFERARSEPFVYSARTKQVTMAYWRAPEEVMESRDVAIRWARGAYAAALRARAKQLTHAPSTQSERARPRKKR